MMQVQGEGTAAQGVNSKIELTQVLFLQEATNASLGDQPESSTRYFGPLPLLEGPRIQPSQTPAAEETQ